MRKWPSLLVLLVVAVSKASPPTYDEAVKLSESIVHDAHAKQWIEGALAPFSDQHLDFKAMIQACVEMLGEGSTSVRFVVDVQAAPNSVVIYDDAPTPFSGCIKSKLEALKWPSAPENIRYLPIEINVHKPKDEVNADDVITNVTPSNKSLERTHER
jgi:hypothetical protein